MKTDKSKLEAQQEQLDIPVVSCSINHDKYNELMELKNQAGDVVFKGSYNEFSSCPYKLGEMLSQLGLKVRVYDDL
jgi:hypothetical protein